MVTPHDHDSLWSRALNFYNEFYDWAWHDQLVYRLEVRQGVNVIAKFEY
jgi:hypothetical protein